MTDPSPPTLPSAQFRVESQPDPGGSVVLWEQARAGDRRALEELLVRYQDRLRRVVRIQLGPQVRVSYDSMDFVQVTYQAALRKLDSFEARDAPSLLRWLATIATNQIRDAAKRIRAHENALGRKVSADGGSGEDERSRLLEVVSPESSVSERVSRAELRSLLDETVAALPDSQREVIVLRDYLHESWEHTAAALGTPTVHAARQLHQRAWRELTRRLAPRLTDLGP